MSIVIALDAGHGMYTAGKRCLKSLDPDQTREWWLNDRIMDKVEGTLRTQYDCTVLRVDDTTGAKDVGLSARVKAANGAGADVYLSMHHNAGLNGKRGGGTIVYYYSSAAARQTQARKLYDSIVSCTGLAGNRSSKVIKKSYYVLKNTNAPAFLVENGFMDGPDDVPVILSEAHADKTAKGVVQFLEAEFGLRKKAADGQALQPAPAQKDKYYPAYTGTKTTLSIALQAVGVDYTYAYRKKIAAANGIAGYRGTAAQNTQMYNLLVAGRLVRA